MSYLLQVEHPSTDVEQQWRKAVSLQRKRAVMACFRMIPVYNLSRSFIHLPFNTAPTHTHPFNGPLSWITRVSLYQKGETNLDFTEARDSEWQWHQLGRMHCDPDR